MFDACVNLNARLFVWSREDLNLFYLKSMAEVRELAKSWADANRPEHKVVSDAELPHEAPQVSGFPRKIFDLHLYLILGDLTPPALCML